MKFELEEYHRGITDDELITDLKCAAFGGNGGQPLFLGRTTPRIVCSNPYFLTIPSRHRSVPKGIFFFVERSRSYYK